MKALRLVLISSLALTALSCSRLELALRWADTFVMSSVTDYFELNSAQSAAARAEFKRVLDDIQSEDFPPWSQHLREFAEALERKAVKEAELLAFIDQGEQAFRKTTARFEKMGQMIVADQVASDFKMFDREFEKKYEKDLKKANDPKEQMKQARAKVDRIVSESVGDLTKAQEEMVEAGLRAHPAPQKLLLESRRSVYESFKNARKQESSRVEFVRRFFNQWESLQTPDYRKAREEYRKASKTLILAVFASMTDEQRAHFVDRLRSRAAELEKLSKGRPSS